MFSDSLSTADNMTMFSVEQASACMLCWAVHCAGSDTLNQAAFRVKVADNGDAGEAVNQHPLDAASSSQLVIVNGVISAELSSLASIPDGVYVGGIQHAPAQAVSQHLVSCEWSCHRHQYCTIPYWLGSCATLSG